MQHKETGHRAEVEAVKTFHTKSHYLHRMNHYLSEGLCQESDKQALMTALMCATTFAQMLAHIDNFDELHKEPQAFQMVFKTMVFFGSYVSPSIDFMHNLFKLRDEMNAYAVANGYEVVALSENIRARL